MIKFLKENAGKPRFIVPVAAALLLSVSYGGLKGQDVKAQNEQSADSAAFTPEQLEELGPLIRAYLVQNPEVIMESMDAFQVKQADMERQRFDTNVVKFKDWLHSKDTPSHGNPKGDVTIVEFVDYNCGYCKRAALDVIEIIEADKNVNFLFKDMPILSDSSELAARWALAADKQGKYYDYHMALMKYQGPKTETTLRAIARDVGLDADKLKKDAADPAITAALEKNKEYARELGINGTPAFIIGNRLAPGYMGPENMKETIAQVRAGTE